MFQFNRNLEICNNLFYNEYKMAISSLLCSFIIHFNNCKTRTRVYFLLYCFINVSITNCNTYLFF